MRYYGWHFVWMGRDGLPHLRYDDDRVVVLGQTLSVEGEPEPCVHGLHASAKLSDAIRYAPYEAGFLSWVELSGAVVAGGDKMAATHRRCIGLLDSAAANAAAEAAAAEAIQAAPRYDGLPDFIRKWVDGGDLDMPAFLAWKADSLFGPDANLVRALTSLRSIRDGVSGSGILPAPYAPYALRRLTEVWEHCGPGYRPPGRAWAFVERTMKRAMGIGKDGERIVEVDYGA